MVFIYSVHIPYTIIYETKFIKTFLFACLAVHTRTKWDYYRAQMKWSLTLVTPEPVLNNHSLDFLLFHLVERKLLCYFVPPT